MRKMFFLVIVAVTVIFQIGCGESPKTQAANSYADTQREDRQKETDARTESDRKLKFQRELDLFKQASVVRDAKLLEEYGASSGWFSIACDAQQQLDGMESLYEELIDAKNADLLQAQNLTPQDLKKNVEAVVGRYVWTVSRAAKSITAENRNTVGCTSERGSGSLVALLGAANVAAQKYDVSLVANGFPTGSLRALMIREINADLDELEYRKELLSPDRITAKNASENLDAYLEDFKDMNLTDSELKLTPAMRKVINNPPDTDE